jgi:hypothetical protein
MKDVQATGNTKGHSMTTLPSIPREAQLRIIDEEITSYEESRYRYGVRLRALTRAQAPAEMVRALTDELTGIQIVLEALAEERAAVAGEGQAAR